MGKERSQVKEKLDPIASGGMNGYLCLCNGDPCPPVFRSPVEGMKDIMDNLVICSIYKLPDPHNHITRPPPGLVFPEKTVAEGDLNSPPVLWHEDLGRTPHQDDRQNRPGTISGRVGEAAHRLVFNSLQLRREHSAEESHARRREHNAEERHARRREHSAEERHASLPYNAGWRNDQHHIRDPTPTYPRGNVHNYGHRYPYGNARGQLDGSSMSVHHQYARPQPMFPYNRPYHAMHGSSHLDARGRIPVQSYPRYGGHPYPYASRPTTQVPVPLPNSHPRACYSAGYNSYQLHGVQQREHGSVRGWAPIQNRTGGSSTHDQHGHQPGNHSSAPNRGESSQCRPPPPPGYGR